MVEPVSSGFDVLFAGRSGGDGASVREGGFGEVLGRRTDRNDGEGRLFGDTGAEDRARQAQVAPESKPPVEDEAAPEAQPEAPAGDVDDGTVEATDSGAEAVAGDVRGEAPADKGEAGRKEKTEAKPEAGGAGGRRQGGEAGVPLAGGAQAGASGTGIAASDGQASGGANQESSGVVGKTAGLGHGESPSENRNEGGLRRVEVLGEARTVDGVSRTADGSGDVAAAAAEKLAAESASREGKGASRGAEVLAQGARREEGSGASRVVEDSGLRRVEVQGEASTESFGKDSGRDGGNLGSRGNAATPAVEGASSQIEAKGDGVFKVEFAADRLGAEKLAGVGKSESAQGMRGGERVEGAGGALARTVGRGVGAVLRQGGGSLVMRLTPATLGTVRVQMSLGGSDVSVRLEASTVEARELLRSQLPALKSALEGRGLTVERMGVHLSTGLAGTGSGTSAETGSQQGRAEDAARDSDHDAGNGRSRGSRDGDGREGGGADERERGFDELVQELEALAGELRGAETVRFGVSAVG